MSNIFKKSIPLLLLISLGFNILLGYLYRDIYVQYIQAPEKFPLLSLRLFAQKQNDILINFVPLRKKLYEYIQSKDSSIGMYFEYLPTGNSIGINEKEAYVLASLLKVPLVMAVYKKVENKELDLDKQLIIKETDLDPLFGNLWKKGTGTKLTVRDAIKLALIESDNTANNALFDLINIADIKDVFASLDIPWGDSQNVEVVTPKNYSSVLRSLYLSSYLEREHSNEILEYLTQSIDDDKIAGGVPGDIKVAHKIGVYDAANITKRVFTDCGIVYIPHRPYILCIMVRDHERNSVTFMSDLSKIIYEYLSSVNKS